MYSFGLKPWEDDDLEEGKQILESFVAEIEEEAKEKQKQK
jgi:hypothetical protein